MCPKGGRVPAGKGARETSQRAPFLWYNLLMKFTIITLFPEAVKPYLDSSMLFKAQKNQLVEFDLVNLRDYGLGPHKSVDDTPYGGGDGMLLRPEPIFAAIEEIKKKDPSAETILPTPVGQTWHQALARQFVTNTDKHYIILCPHYEGYDERILSIIDHKISLGNFVLTGGELPALCIIDSITRLIPGVLGGETSADIESFSDGDNLEYPQYTKPAEFRGMKVPDILLSGHHGNIAKWRDEHSGKKAA